jgi:hypothetical protein
MDEPVNYEWSTGPVCGVDNCPSTRYIRNADGSRSCENGHVKLDVIYEEEDYVDPGGRTTRKKKVKVERRKCIPLEPLDQTWTDGCSAPWRGAETLAREQPSVDS